MGTNQPCRIVVGISSQIGRDGHRDMGDVNLWKNYSKPPRFDETSRFESLAERDLIPQYSFYKCLPKEIYDKFCTN